MNKLSTNINYSTEKVFSYGKFRPETHSRNNISQFKADLNNGVGDKWLNRSIFVLSFEICYLKGLDFNIFYKQADDLYYYEVLFKLDIDLKYPYCDFVFNVGSLKLCKVLIKRLCKKYFRADLYTIDL
jgi:hypothetical protein